MITQIRLKELFNYDSETGNFIFLKSRGCRSAGSMAGVVKREWTGKVYRYIKIDKKTYSCHRLAFLYMNGEFPNKEVDHINGNGLDNIWANLRDVTRTENNRNTCLRKDNTSNVCGVSRCYGGKWQAYISHNGKRIYLGVYDLIDHAVDARKKAEETYGYHENHGVIRLLA